MIEHKETCLKVNVKQSVKLKSGSNEFKNHFKQLGVPFKIYADFEYLLKGVRNRDKNNTSYTEKYQDHIPCSFASKVVCSYNKQYLFSKKAVLYRGENAVYRFIEAILKEYDHLKKIIKKIILIRILLCLQKLKKVIYVGYMTNYLMLEIIK